MQVAHPDFRHYSREEIESGRYIVDYLNVGRAVKQTKELKDKSAEDRAEIRKQKKAAWRKYKNLVWKITNSQPLQRLSGYSMRGFATFHVDHKIPIVYGFKNGIAPEVIGHINNLQILQAACNLQKGTKYEPTSSRGGYK